MFCLTHERRKKNVGKLQPQYRRCGVFASKRQSRKRKRWKQFRLLQNERNFTENVHIGFDETADSLYTNSEAVTGVQNTKWNGLLTFIWKRLHSLPTQAMNAIKSIQSSSTWRQTHSYTIYTSYYLLTEDLGNIQVFKSFFPSICSWSYKSGLIGQEALSGTIV